MNQRFLFKLIAIAATVILLTIVFLPLVASVFALKEDAVRYGRSFLDLNWKTNILVSFAIGMSLGVWNAFEFEKYPTLDFRQYLKPAQRYNFKTSQPVEMKQLQEAVQKDIIRKGWKVKQWAGDGVTLLRRNYLMKDVVKIRIIPQGLEISSRPRWRILLVDMARNYRNIMDVSQRIKHLK